MLNVRTKYIDDDINDSEYHTFIDFIMKPNVDYINLIFTHYRTQKDAPERIKQTARSMTEKEIEKIINQIMDLYNNYETNIKKYDKMIKSYRKK